MNHNRVVTEWREPAWRSQLKNLLAYSRTQVVWRNDPRYGETVKIFNRIHEERPAVFVSTLQPEVIKEVFALARRESIPVSIRGGGHHIAGFSLCQDGIVIDFSPFRGVAYDPKTQIAHVQPGARLRDVDQTLCPLGRVVPSGTISDTGIAGLTLGGGIGWLIGRYGLTCDSLVGADVVLTDGRHLRAEDPGHEGLLWALRGGGGNFGAVTAFRYRTHPLPRFQMGSGIIDADASFAPLSRVLAFLETAAPTTLSVAPVLAAGENGRRVLSIDYCMADPCDSVIENLITASGPSVTWRHYHNMPFHDWQSAFDAPFLEPRRGYWKAHYLPRLTNDEIRKLVEHFLAAPFSGSSIMFEHLHGKFSEVTTTSSAFPFRQTCFGVLVSARWVGPESDQAAIRWVREGFSLLADRRASFRYSNYADTDDCDAISQQLQSNAELVRLKNQYDPNNILNRNHNIFTANSQG